MIKNILHTYKKHQIRTQFLPFLKNCVDQKIQYKQLSRAITNQLLQHTINNKGLIVQRHQLYLTSVRENMLQRLIKNEYVLV